jgi:transposase-like protein
LSGVQLVISDHHLGLKAAIAAVFTDSSWQRCRVHYAERRIMWSRREDGQVAAVSALQLSA